jgi:hypothetical protein
LEIKLLVTKNQKSNYICLSHCWGKGEQIKTTPQTYETHLKGIEYDKLSQTFKDAVLITRSLGSRYLWIDSLCIIQEQPDLSDWVMEASKMATVYKNALVTIAATGAKDGTGGCFNEEKDEEILVSDKECQTYSAHVRRHIEHTDLDSQEFPLLTRGWVYQERLLSPRFLQFGKKEIAWECMEQSLCECGTSNTKEIRWKMLCYTTLSDLKEEWWQLIENYSRLDLSYETDKLPALSGLAKQMLENRKGALSRLASESGLLHRGEYLVGMWRTSLREDLLWYSETHPRPKKYCAPSWSWASVRYGIGFLKNTMNVVISDQFSIEEVYCTLVGDDPTGRVTGGVLRLEGKTCSGTLSYNFSNPRRVKYLVSDISKNKSGNSGEFFFGADYPLEKEGFGYLEPGTTVFCLEMGTNENVEFMMILKYMDCTVYARIRLALVEVGKLDELGVEREVKEFELI